MNLGPFESLTPRAEQPQSALRAVHQGICRLPGRLFNYGTPPLERDWDVLVVLDACRNDLFEGVADDYDFVESNDPTYSVASSSLQWMTRTFAPEYESEIEGTALVTGNMKSSDELHKSNGETLHDRPFQVFDEVWRYAWDDGIGIIPPKPVTDRAITVYREEDPDRMVVHYMQPHEPFVTRFLPDETVESGEYADAYGVATNDREGVDDRPDDYERPWERLESGAADYETIWRRYTDNLRYVLASVRILLSNIDADDVVITSDHGNLLGEVGLYGHPIYVLHPALRKVPWATATARNTERYEPPEYDRDREVGPSVETKLAQLGYK